MKKALEILYEDNHIVVAIKPQNMPTQADSSKDRDFLNEIKKYIKEKYGKPGEAFIGLVQRLDRPVGGVMIFARTSKAAQRLSAQVRDRTIIKTYLAIVTNAPIKKEGKLFNYLIKDTAVNISRVVEKDHPDAKFAELSYNTVYEKDGYTLLKIKLSTGRSHQIRVQLAHNHSPILGDNKYGGAPAQNICLWSYGLEFTHPTTKERMSFFCPPPHKNPWTVFNIEHSL